MGKYDLEKKAMDFAIYHHGKINHVRKYTGLPYIVHPAAVVKIVRSVPHTPEMLAAAWLHDTVEDTEATIEDIMTEFGSEVAVLVAEVTDVSVKSDGTRAFRKALDREHIAKASPDAKTVKLADIIDNTKNILLYDTKFAAVYIPEKRALLEVLTEGDKTLMAKAKEMIRMSL